MDWYWEQPKAAFRSRALWWFGSVNRTHQTHQTVKSCESSWVESGSWFTEFQLTLPWWKRDFFGAHSSPPKWMLFSLEEVQMHLLERAMGDRRMPWRARDFGGQTWTTFFCNKKWWFQRFVVLFSPLFLLGGHVSPVWGKKAHIYAYLSKRGWWKTWWKTTKYRVACQSQVLFCRDLLFTAG